MIQRALISVTDKEGVDHLAKELKKIFPEIEILSTGGTANYLSDAGIATTLIEEYTKFPECFEGRVKTLHPKVLGGILYNRKEHREEAKKQNIPPIDLVICNLYNFRQAYEMGQELDQLVESIDIGGVTLIRAALKNHADVTIVVNPKDYPRVIETLKKHHEIPHPMREKFAEIAINYLADEHAFLAVSLTQKISGEATHRPTFVEGERLRYGENPDQSGWVYKLDDPVGIAAGRTIGQKKLSYNNYEDATAANQAVQRLLGLGVKNAFAIVKHGSLCGFATDFERAWEGDPKSAFGSVVASLNPVTEELIDSLKGKFIEMLVAPKFSDPFVAWCEKNKPNLRLLEVNNRSSENITYKSIDGGLLMQTAKTISVDELHTLFQKTESAPGIVTKNSPPTKDPSFLAFALAAVCHAKSNAIAIVRQIAASEYQLIGMGAGQPNRIDSLERLALPKAIETIKSKGEMLEETLKECLLVSDGFFPFDDSVKAAAKCGIRHIIQPGGSKRDQEVIEAADQHQMSMIFTGERYFTH